MPRISIYVDDDLHTQMSRTPKVNWSSIAQQAFEIEIACRRDQFRAPFVRETLIAQCEVWLRGLTRREKRSA